MTYFKKFIRAAILIAVIALALPGASCGSSPTTGASGARNAAPDFQLPALDGGTVALSQYRGHPVLLNFWASWCGPCREEMPYLQQVDREWQDRGLVILAVNLGESAQVARAFLEENGLDLKVALDSDSSVGDRYFITAIPTTYLIDKDGIIQDKVVGSFPSKASIETHLKILFPAPSSN